MIPVNALPPIDTTMDVIHHIHSVAKSKESTYELLRSEEEATNEFLDAIFRIKERFVFLIKGGSELYDLIRECYFDFSKDSFKIVYDEFVKLNEGLLETYIITRKSKFFSCVKKTVIDFKDMLDDLRELQEDINIFQHSLPNDEEYKEISDQLNLLF